MASHFRVHTWSSIVVCYIAILIVMAKLNTPAGEALHLTMASSRLYDTNSSGTTTFSCFKSIPPSSETTLNFKNPFLIQFLNGTVHQMTGRALEGDELHTNNGQAVTVSSNATYNAAGLFTCEVSNVNSSTFVYSVTHTRKGNLDGFYFNSGTHMINAGENLTLSILSTDENGITPEFFRVRTYKISYNASTERNHVIGIPYDEVQHGDLYGARRRRPYDPASMIRIIVRGCPAGRWGPPNCTALCDQCYNGGVCDDKTGQCICAPGFSGVNCSNACGKHRFGWECEFECGQTHVVKSCTGTQFSLPDPYGSSCISGYSGRDCDTACPNGTYGAGCTQTCNCLGSSTCDRYTGVCPVSEGPTDESYLLLIVVSSVSGVFLIVLILALIGACCNRLGSKSGTTVANTGMRQPSQYVPSPILAHEDDRTQYENFVNGIPSWATCHHINRESMRFGTNILSLGHFGEVTDGSVTKNGTVHEATISTLKASASAEERGKFMTAFESTTRIGNHPNLVNILGVCLHDDELCVALEFMPYGNLRSHLRKWRSTVTGTSQYSETLLKFALDVARGMQHLATNKIVHQDLAARNILLDADLVAKISDFGLSRVENTYLETTTLVAGWFQSAAYVQEDIPFKLAKNPDDKPAFGFQKRVSFRWKPLEALNTGRHSSKTDVWSFGVLLWEIVTLGATPYSAIPTNMLASKLKSGYRLPKPSYCSPEIYEQMQRCWHVNPQERLSFRKLIEILSFMCTESKHIRLSSRPEAVNFHEIRPELDDN